MLNKFAITLLLTCITITSKAQGIDKYVADSLLNSLSRSAPDTDRITVLLKLATFNIQQRKASITQLNTANQYIQEASRLNKKLKHPSFTNNIVLAQSGLLKAEGNLVAGKLLLEKLIAVLKSGSDEVLLGEAYFKMSEYYSNDFLRPTMQQRIKFLQLAIAAYEGTSHWVELAGCYRFLADLHQLTNDSQSAFTEIRTALKYYRLANYKETQGANSLLGRLYYERGDYKLALHYELIALKIATNSIADNVRLICQINNNIGYTYSKLNDNQKALPYFLEALRIAEGEKDSGTIYLLAANVTDVYIKLNAPVKAQYFFADINKKYAHPVDQKYEGGDYAISQTYLKIFMALKNFDKARFYYDKLINETKNSNINLYTLSNYYELIIDYNIRTKDYKKAQYYLEKNRTLLDTVNDLPGIARNYKLWFSLDTARNDYKSAVSNKIKADKINDSIFNSTKSMQIAQLQVEFETEKKENEIKFLNQKAILEKAKLEQADVTKNVTIVGIVLIFIIAILIYKQSRLTKKNNIVITHKNKLLQSLLTEKEWLLKEVHHRVKNNLHTVICLLESQAIYLEEDALRAIESSQHRIYAMSLIHQKLYQADDLATINIYTYLHEFINYLSDSFGAPANINIHLQVEEVKLNVSQAIPLGLIINEAVTNAFKYAFPHNAVGDIIIQLKQIDKTIKLVIADNGIGMGFVNTDLVPSSLGVELMKGLTEELLGTIQFENKNGTKITIYFPIELINISENPTSAHQFNPLEI